MPYEHVTLGDLINFAESFSSPDTANATFASYYTSVNQEMNLDAPCTEEDKRVAKNLITSSIGTVGVSSEPIEKLVEVFLDQGSLPITDVLAIVDNARQFFEFMQELVQSSIENISLGITVIDKNLRMVAWNRRYLQFFDYPDGFVHLGQAVEELVRYNIEKGEYGHVSDVETEVARRLAQLISGDQQHYERFRIDGTVLEIFGNPMPGGGFVTSYNDITDHKKLIKKLEVTNETLEQRVTERTKELTSLNQALIHENKQRAKVELELREAKQEAEQANFSKTQFLAAASHDLMQPLNAAGLFASALHSKIQGADKIELVENIQASLDAAEGLLNSLLEASRLGAGALKPKFTVFSIEDLISTLDAEFTVLAKERGLAFSKIPSTQIVKSDQHLLRRILQNFLSNAIKYTQKGRVVLGCRVRPGICRIEVWDTGPGIPEDKRQEVFQEFRRLQTDDGHVETGLGLGLAIAERIALLLGHVISLSSWPGKGSVFAVDVPLGDKAEMEKPVNRFHQHVGHLDGRHIMCIDNDEAVLAGMRALLEGWGCIVETAIDLKMARHRLAKMTTTTPAMILADYQLNDGITGIQVLDDLRADGITCPAIIITANNTPDVRLATEQNGYKFLPKPLKPASLRAVMTSLLG